MFNNKKFKEFVESQIVWLGRNYNSLSKKEVLDAVCQFDQSIYKVLNKNNADVANKQLRKIFTTKSKPISVSLNFWFLYKFGYKRCYRCKEITEISNFSRDKSRWDLLNRICKLCSNIEGKNWYKNNPDKAKLYNKNWRKNNPEKVKLWIKNNPDKVNAKSTKRRALKLKATPSWLTKQDYIEIEDIYYQAIEYERLLGKKFHVDHIIPLQGNNVCGLHVPWNLQVLTAKENLEKGNSYK